LAGPINPRVVVLGVPVAEGLPSIDRFSAELMSSLRGRDDLDAATYRPGESNSRAPGSLDRQLVRFVRYPRTLRRISADVFHIVDQSYAHLLRVLPRGRVVVTCHDLTPYRIRVDGLPVRQRRAVFARYRFSTRSLPGARCVACVSETTRADLTRFLDMDPDRIEVISPGLADRFVQLGPERRAELRLGLGVAEAPVLLHVDSGLPYKNVAGTLRILRALHDVGVPARLLRAGSRMKPEERSLAADLGILDAVTEKGRVTDERLVELYNAADVLVFPSFYEGFGWPPLEAMACGTPVVVSDCPALVELVGPAGLAAGADDIEALTAATASILGSRPLANRLREAGLRRASAFSWERCAASYAEIYRRIASSGG
jgi:glycosyltransferase involved in cell wall biosynthesis